MLINLDTDSGKPLYIQLYTDLKFKIQQGELKSDIQLPSKRSLAELNGISQNTVINAYDQLLTEGYIYAIERKGYYVSDIQHLFKVEPTSSAPEPPSLKTHDYIRFNFTESVADPSLFPFDAFKKIINQVLDSHNPLLLQTTDKQGLLELRQALQQYLSQSRGVPCSAEQIILAPSTQYLMQLVMQLLPQVTDVGIEDPGYKGANQLLRLLGYQLHPLALDQAGVMPQSLNHTRAQLLYLTPNHQFPTGTIMPLERRQSLLAWTQEFPDRYIIEDDYDSEFKYSGIPVPSLKQLDTTDQIIYMGSFSRILAPGLRFSYMVLPYPLLERFRETHSQLTSPLNTINQWMLYEFIKSAHFERHLNRSRRFYKKKREHLIGQILQQDPAANIIGADAGLHILLRPSWQFNTDQLTLLANQQHLQIATLSDYATLPTPDDHNTLFLSFSSIDLAEIETAVTALYELIRQASETN